MWWFIYGEMVHLGFPGELFKNIFSGVVGSCIGFLGVTLTLAVNRRWEVRKMQEQRRWELELTREQRRWELTRAEEAKAEERMAELRGELLKLKNLLVESASYELLSERKQELMGHIMTIAPMLGRGYPRALAWFNHHSEALLDVILSSQVSDKDFQAAHRGLLEGIIHWVAEPKLWDGFFAWFSDTTDGE